MDKVGSVSFNFKSRKEVGPLKIKSAIEDTVEEVEKRDYVVAVDDKEIKSVLEKKKQNGPLVIPLISTNKWRNPSKDTKGNFALESSQANDLDKAAVLELIEDAKRHLEVDQSDAPDTNYEIPLLMRNKAPEGSETDEKLNYDIRPEESTLDDYEKVPIEQYGMALLRGMGWKDGEGIGRNKKLVKPIEPHLRPKGMGLGADRSAVLQEKDKTSKSGLKPGDTKKEEKLVIKKGAFCMIIKGPHTDLYGVIDGLDEDNSRCIVKLSLSQQSVTISQFSIKLVHKHEYDKYSRYLNKGKSDYYKDISDSKLNGYRDSPPEKKIKTDHRPEKNQSKDSKINQSTHRVRRWVYPHLKVKIIDKKYKDGHYYSSKVLVDDVLPESIVCKSESGKLLEGLTEDQLETVIPREANSYVMIVHGEYKKELAVLKERLSDKESVLVQLLSDRSTVLNLNYDYVCQYDGNVEDFLDY